MRWGTTQEDIQGYYGGIYIYIENISDVIDVVLKYKEVLKLSDLKL